ncbi:unnamed protein product, partial [Linum tenue]
MELRRVTGSAALHHGLYHMTNIGVPSSPKPIIATTTAKAFDLWHYRLGHVSHFKIPQLKTFCKS